LKQAIEGEPDVATRVQTVLRFLASFTEQRPALERLTTAEPAFVIGFFHSNGPELLSTIAAALAPAFGADPNRRRRNRNATILSEMIFRIMLSYQLVPRDPESTSIDQIATVFDSYVTAQAVQ
jgi:hypothetical protein